MDRAHPVAVPEVAGGPLRWVELGDLPAYQDRLGSEVGQEVVDGGSVFDVPEQLACPSAGDACPLITVGGEQRGGTPLPLGQADGGAVSAG